ncbi:hypothetical protein Afil01_50040 [Actinorhabdospora filicis]|uniref:Uncharacterized protein n=1 Tax=Actinorhabdospora filicis TaxID=1785913 RepID=A0A9W6W5B5_9ACTN|nr:DUF4386 family protein [Actinorhabdospora filicis]GLZ80197.1 hypothetical protein Afil01_50040 [Actinorhabdospora filicis]
MDIGLARLTGTLFITATLAGVPGAALLGTTAGAALLLLMAAAIAMIPAAVFPVLRRHGEAAAAGYLAARVLEAVLLLPAVGGRQEDWTYAGGSLFFCLSALILNTVLYRARLVPRWISGWGLLAVAPYLTGAALVMCGVLGTSSPALFALVVPLAVNEMALAARLLAKGYTSV